VIKQSITHVNPTVGLLYAGEMGAALARALRCRGVRVVTTVSGRSDQTRLRSCEAGIEILPNLSDVVAASDVILSVVPPDAAEEVALMYCACAAAAPANAIYVDINSIRPVAMKSIAEQLRQLGVNCVDAAINGLASRLETAGTLFLSGLRAHDIERLFTSVMRVHNAGPSVGQASMMKMLLAGMSKGVCAMYVELALLAQRSGILGDFNGALSQIYPGVSALVDRMLPTYTIHAGRRAVEMGELQATLQDAGQKPCIIASVRRLHAMLADVVTTGAIRGDCSSPSEIIEELNLHHLLASETTQLAAHVSNGDAKEFSNHGE
jgi:3-hydroxyisobutyrate dehydrogenase-like beta-hydroxyacid dehydrogenase